MNPFTILDDILRPAYLSVPDRSRCDDFQRLVKRFTSYGDPN